MCSAGPSSESFASPDLWRAIVTRPVFIRSGAVRSKSTAAELLKPLDAFSPRHNGTAADLKAMLDVVGVRSLDELVDKTVPASIRLKKALDLPPALGEREALASLKALMDRNKVMQSFIGQGYYDTVTPNVILRNIIENPQWYTPYTPYQAEISQGRMESLMNYQTMVVDMTKCEIANASLLDEATAAAEAMTLAFGHAKQKRANFFVDASVFPQSLAVLQSRAEPLGIKVHVGDFRTFDFAAHDCMGALVQYPNAHGEVHDLQSFVERVHAANGLAIVGTDLLALTVLKAPGEFGADIAYGNSQRFGVPMGYGGPHAAFFSVKNDLARKMPGRLIGLTRDATGKNAYRLTLQTREQHIRRSAATSNICTAQALLANVAAMYACYHGPAGLKQIASRTHLYAVTFVEGAKRLGVQRAGSAPFFDTVALQMASPAAAERFVAAAKAAGMLLAPNAGARVQLSFDETTNAEHLTKLWSLLADGRAVPFSPSDVANQADSAIPRALERTSSYLTHANFNSYHTEHELLRYANRLQSKDIGLHHSAIMLGSCTMKLNATAEMIPVTWPTVGRLHPFAPRDTTMGYAEFFKQLEKYLCEVTGFDAMSLQPNAGAAGEYAGLLAIRGYHAHRNEGHRDVVLIPDSAHGTNPASASMAGFKVIGVKTVSATGDVDLEDLRAKAEKHAKSLAALMVTYPSTFGVFEEHIRDVIDVVHKNGGQVYMDGANMNAQVGLTAPGLIGADVCHLNLHKTFCIPHGGGGPGMGPIGVKAHLAPFLASHPVVPQPGRSGLAVAAAPWSSASILPISYMYIRMMGNAGLTEATMRAILNANYLAARLKKHYEILYVGKHGYSAHEFIVDLRPLEKSSGVSAVDVAKRLQDYSFHAPTMSWPVAGTLMVEPTESETLAELNKFCDAMISIRKEIAEIESGKADRALNVLKMAPHTAEVLMGEWNRPYSRQQAAYPLKWLQHTGRKFWPSVSRVDDVYGDRNLNCTCPPVSEYEQVE